MKDRVNKIVKVVKEFVLKYYYIIVSILLLLQTFKEYKDTDKITIYCIFYFALALIFLGIHLYEEKIKNCKVVNFFPKNKLMVLIFLIVIITSTTCFKYNNDRIIYQQQVSSGVTEPLLVKSQTQEIYTKDVNINTIAIKFATYARVNDADYKFMLYENDNVIVERYFNANQTRDGEYLDFRFENTYINPQNKYKIEVMPINATDANCITIFENVEKNEINYRMLDSRTDYLKIICIAVFGIIFLILNYIINTKKLSSEKFYMLCGIYLVSMMLIIPPWNVPDEPVHYYRAYKLSQITFDKSFEENMSGTSINGPIEWCINYSGIETQNKVYSRQAIFDCLKEHENVVEDRGMAANLGGNNPINHMFAAIGMKIVDVFTNSPLIIFFAGRLANLLISFIIIYFAIKIAPKNKLIILLVATIPMFVQQMASYSYDSVLNASCLFIVAYIINLYEKDKWTVKDWVLMAIMALFVFSIKNIYIFLFAPLFFKKIKDKKKAVKTIAITLFALFVAYEVMKLWPNYLASLNDASESVSGESSTPENMTYLLNNSLQLFPLVYNTFVKNGWFYLRGLFGYFGWFVFSIDDIYIWIYLIMIYLMLTTKGLTHNIFNVKQKVVSFIACALMFAASFAAMYFYWSSYKLYYIDGVQGRYFIPLLGLLLVTLIPKKQRKVELKEKDFFTFINIMFVMSIILLICKYY